MDEDYKWRKTYINIYLMHVYVWLYVDFSIGIIFGKHTSIA